MSHHRPMLEDFQRRFWISLFLTIPILLLSPMIREFLHVQNLIAFNGDIYVLFGLATTVFFYGGWPFLMGFVQELKKRQLGMMTLIAVAITTAYIYSSLVVFKLSGNVFFWELATLIDIMLLGHWIEMKSVMSASTALEQLASLMPAVAHKVVVTGNVQDIPLEDLAIGDKVLVKPGEKIPADGLVIEGETSVNESLLTGESNPIIKKINTNVIGGSINDEGSIIIEVKKTGNDSYLSQMIELVKEAQNSKSKTQDLANRAAGWLTLLALAGGVITLLIWILFTNQSFAFALERMVTVMIITCPHALGLAVPLVVAISTAIAAKNGLLIRNRAAFETARNINAMVFDKTGTLTQGKFSVTDILVFDPTLNKDKLLDYAAAVEAHSEHPVAHGILKASKNILPITQFKAIPGKGAEGKIDKQNVKVVSQGYLEEMNLKFDEKMILQIHNLNIQGKTLIFVLIDNIVKGAITLADIIRPEARNAITDLKAMGIRCLMLTGDNKQAAKWVADTLGLDEYFAEVLPQDKVAKIKEVQKNAYIVGMTGDGINDAAAIAQANVGIAFGAGTDIAIETADIVLVKNNISDVVSIIKLSRATTNKIIQNLLWATGYNVIAIPIAAGALFSFGILLSPALGAILMSLSTVIVALNAKLLTIN